MELTHNHILTIPTMHSFKNNHPMKMIIISLFEERENIRLRIISQQAEPTSPVGKKVISFYLTHFSSTYFPNHMRQGI